MLLLNKPRVIFQEKKLLDLYKMIRHKKLVKSFKLQLMFVLNLKRFISNIKPKPKENGN